MIKSRLMIFDALYLLLHIAGKPTIAVKRVVRVTRRQCDTEDTVEVGRERAQRAAHQVAKMSTIVIMPHWSTIIRG